MVRIKERYLLVNILYPPDPKASQAGVPVHVVQHQPTLDKLTASTLAKAIRAEVFTLFGDYGAGAMQGDLSGENSLSIPCAYLLVLGRHARTHTYVPGPFQVPSEPHLTKIRSA